ncbi:MAG: Crp/Fnr family transcriptional regulator [Silvibacterium sp.]
MVRSNLNHQAYIAKPSKKKEDEWYMKAQEKLKMLQKAELFGQVPADALKKLAGLTRERRLQRGEILFTAGDLAVGLFVIVSGTLRAFRQTLEGREQTIHVESAGATLAEVPVFDGGPYPSTVEAEEDTVTLFLPKAAIHRFLLENPEAALSALGVLARRLRHVAGLVEKLSLQDVAQRLAAMLIEEAIKQAGSLKNGTSFSMPLHHQSIAARLGSVREVITRHLNKLADEGVIAIRGHRIVVLDAEALQVRAGLQSEKQSPGAR